MRHKRTDLSVTSLIEQLRNDEDSDVISDCFRWLSSSLQQAVATGETGLLKTIIGVYLSYQIFICHDFDLPEKKSEDFTNFILNFTSKLLFYDLLLKVFRFKHRNN